MSDFVEVVAVRSFFFEGKPQKKGTRVTVPRPLSVHLIQGGKAKLAEALTPETTQAPEPEIPETRGRRRAGAARSEES